MPQKRNILNLYGLLSKLFDETRENYSPTVHYMVGEILEPVMMKMASLIKPKKPGVMVESDNDGRSIKIRRNQYPGHAIVTEKRISFSTSEFIMFYGKAIEIRKNVRKFIQ